MVWKWLTFKYYSTLMCIFRKDFENIIMELCSSLLSLHYNTFLFTGPLNLSKAQILTLRFQLWNITHSLALHILWLEQSWWTFMIFTNLIITINNYIHFFFLNSMIFVFTQIVSRVSKKNYVVLLILDLVFKIPKHILTWISKGYSLKKCLCYLLYLCKRHRLTN